MDRRRAAFTPGWRDNPWLKLKAPLQREVTVATWDHGAAGQGLAVVSNLDTDQEHEVVVRWTGFAKPQVTNARTGEAVTLADNVATVNLGPESFVLLRAESNRTGGP